MPTPDEIRALGEKVGSAPAIRHGDRFNQPYINITPTPDTCAHIWNGSEITIGNGSSRTCSKCGMDAMSYDLRMGI